MTNFKRTLVTSALPYANGPVHIGHLAGVYVPADIYTRYLRLKGEDVLFIGGSDEHGVPITLKARKEGISPQDVVDKYHNLIKKSFEDFGISFDIYSRTTSKVHHETAAQFFRTLYDKGKFLEKESEQYFDPEAQQFLADRYITGTCPHCHKDGAYGDQCESCGTSLNAMDLINPRSVISGSTPVLKKTKHWYLPLDKHEPFLKKWILEDHKEWKSNVYGQCKSWIDLGLQPRAVSRDLDWGVPIPVEGAEGKVLYVWFDAPIGYISATKELTPDWEKYWKDFQARNNNELVAIYGNFVNRSIVLTHKYYNGVVPTPGQYNDFDKETATGIQELIGKVEVALDNFRFREAVKEAMNLARLGNKYLADTEPWKLIKTDPERVKTIMYISLQITAALSILMEPFMPFSSRKLRDMLGMEEADWAISKQEEILEPGHKINEGELLFQKIEDTEIDRQLEKLAASKKANEMDEGRNINPQKDNISFDDFSKMDIRVGTILEAEKLPKTKKLLRLKIDTGLDQRTVVSGIAEHFNPEEIIGRQVTMLVNLEPRNIKGIESQGMILMAEDADGKLVFVGPDKKIGNGSEVR
jgi:methionine--tRNA ligase beta chain